MILPLIPNKVVWFPCQHYKVPRGVFNFTLYLRAHSRTPLSSIGVKTVNGTALEGKDYIGLKKSVSLGISE